MREVTLRDPGTRPRRLAVDMRGTVWYTDYARNYLGAYDPARGTTREWRSPSENAKPYGIVIGPDGRIWLALSGTGRIGLIDLRTAQ
jgi:virginiamycin B lyase